MPEGPELYLSAKYINFVSRDKTFLGATEVSDVARGPAVNLGYSCTLSAVSRGKELKLIFQGNEGADVTVLFHFGMTGNFKLTSAEELPKHSHFRIFTLDPPGLVLNYVDQRRFGKWKLNYDWSADRGPDPITEYFLFRKNVLTNLKDAYFSKPICEVLLSPKYFNGIGNYLRAEILYRLTIPPFDPAIEVLSELPLESNKPDILSLCKSVPEEAIKLEKSKYFDDFIGESDQALFSDWLQCYGKPQMKSLKDHNKRTIWFVGRPGKLIPGGSRSVRGRGSRNKLIKFQTDDESSQVES